jgi:hypothetical protein
MKPFNSVTDFIKYYNNKQKMPSSVAIVINGKEHLLSKNSRHNMNDITKNQIDMYRFKEIETYGLGVELTVTYYRYFEAKVILESYFTFYHDDDVLFLSPIYFYDKFVNDSNFDHCKKGLSDSLEKWTGLKWVNMNIVSNAFSVQRTTAYNDAQKELLYTLPGYIYGYDDDEIDPIIKYSIDEKRKKKWLMEKNGESPYFHHPIEVPYFW